MKEVTRGKGKISVGEDDPLNIKQLGEYMIMSRSTIYARVADGYKFEFPHNRTTPRHFKKWLRAFADREPEPASAEARRLEHELSQLR